ncbi:MAG: helix-turn-helix transcriptional regulator [Spirochaetes bacterium]|nr:helix-turn-helix transcriptional regulator [Spirochaetota bacterium]
MKKTTSPRDIVYRMIIPRGSRERFLPRLHPNCRSLTEFGVTMAGTSEVVPGYTMGRPEPPFHVFLFTRSGRAEIRFADKKLAIPSGSFLIAPTKIPYEYTIVGRRWDFVWFHLAANRYWSWLEKKPIMLMRSDAHELIDTLMKTIITATLAADPASNVVAQSASTLMRSVLEREIRDFREPPDKQKHAVMHTLADEMSSKLDQQWTLERMAEFSGVSKRELNRMALDTFGASPLACITRFRMERARELLKNSDYRILDIAGMVGYTDEFAFSAAFKRIVGLSPKKFRSAK